MTKLMPKMVALVFSVQEVFLTRPCRRRPRAQPRTCCRVSRLARKHLGLLQVELEQVSVEREVWESTETAAPATWPADPPPWKLHV